MQTVCHVVVINVKCKPKAIMADADIPKADDIPKAKDIPKADDAKEFVCFKHWLAKWIYFWNVGTLRSTSWVCEEGPWL